MYVITEDDTKNISIHFCCDDCVFKITDTHYKKIDSSWTLIYTIHAAPFVQRQ